MRVTVLISPGAVNRFSCIIQQALALPWWRSDNIQCQNGLKSVLIRKAKDAFFAGISRRASRVLSYLLIAYDQESGGQQGKAGLALQTRPLSDIIRDNASCPGLATVTVTSYKE